MGVAGACVGAAGVAVGVAGACVGVSWAGVGVSGSGVGVSGSGVGVAGGGVPSIMPDAVGVGVESGSCVGAGVSVGVSVGAHVASRVGVGSFVFNNPFTVLCSATRLLFAHPERSTIQSAKAITRITLLPFALPKVFLLSLILFKT